MLNERSYFIDNAKYVLINLVVFGHIIEPILKDDILYALYINIYLFHMPCFIMISGYLASKSHNRRISNLVIPYIIFQVLYCLFEMHILKNDFHIQLAKPYWIMWFLVSLILWKIILPYFIKLKHPIIISFILAVLVGYDQTFGYSMSLSRTVVFFPFYLLGYYAKDKYIEVLDKGIVKILGGCVLIIGLLVSIKMSVNFKVEWLYGSVPYTKLNEIWYAGGYRLLILLLGVALSVSFVSLIPKNRTFVSNHGRRTLQVYLLHGFIIKLMIHYDVYQYLDSLYKQVWLIAFGVITTYILSLPVIESVLSILIKPNISFMIESEDECLL